MNKKFILIDKTNNVQKGANTIVKFTTEEKDYLIYSIDENDQNKQIFVSQLILNSEGKYYIDNITPDKKNKLSNIVYNIIILTPSNAKKGGMPTNLIKELTEKFNIKISTEIPELSEQEYYTNCSIAITGKEFVEDAIKFYVENITAEKVSAEENNFTPTWTMPTSETPATPAEIKPITDIVPPVVEEPIGVVPLEPTPIVPISPEQTVSEPINAIPQEQAPVVNNTVVTPMVETNSEPIPSVESNPQTVIMSDPSLGINNNMQPNVVKKNAGFTINKYIIIGTACIIIAIAVVVVAYILIQKKINGA